MLKGHVFSQQLFENQIFALFINTFLNGANGVSNNYKNGMAVTYSGSNVTIASGAVCIQGRFLEENTSTTLSAGTNTMYCKLIIEIDLDKTNTESDFAQGCYKIITSSSGYPELTQTDIVKNVSGVYQYELARFKTTTNGITDFQDMRTFLDFNSIYTAIQTEYRNILEQLEEELEDVEDGSAYVLKNNFAVINGNMTLDANTGEKAVQGLTTNTTVSINFPTGFNADNSVVISAGRYGAAQGMLSYGWSESINAMDLYNSIEPFKVSLNKTNVTPYSEKIKIEAGNLSTSQQILYYKIVLMKI